MRRAPRLLAAAALLLAAVVAPGAGAAQAVAECDDLVVSPTYRTDGTLFCYRDFPELLIWSTTDRGKTWQVASPAGLEGNGKNWIIRLLPSPTYSQDHALFIVTSRALYVSTDRGATVLPLDVAAGTTYSISNYATLRRVAPVQPLVPWAGVLFAQTYQAGPPTLLLPPQRTPAAGAPGSLDIVLAPPAETEGPFADRVLGLGDLVPEFATTKEPRPTFWACNAVLACPTRLSSMTEGHLVYWARLSTDFARTGVVHVVTITERGTYQPWISRDGGATVERLPSAERLLVDPGALQGVAPDFRIVSDPRRPNRLYLRMHRWRDTEARAYEEMYRSEDGGRSWKRIGFSHVDTSHYASPPGWPGASPFGAISGMGESMEVLPDGRILVVGADAQGRYRVHCSMDDARTWAPFCR